MNDQEGYVGREEMMNQKSKIMAAQDGGRPAWGGVNEDPPEGRERATQGKHGSTEMYGWLGEPVSRCALDKASAHASTLVWLPHAGTLFPSTIPTTAMLCHVP